MLISQSLIFFILVIKTFSQTQIYNYSNSVFDKEYLTGKWDFFGKDAINRANYAVIIGAFYPLYGVENDGSILDVGCGVGILSDFLQDKDRNRYTGIDISSVAIKIAKEKRKKMTFYNIKAEHFNKEKKILYDFIIFNESIYYMNHMAILRQYTEYLAPNGTIILSIWFNEKIAFGKKIFRDASNFLVKIDDVTVSGSSDNWKSKKGIGSRVGAFRPNNQKTS